MKLYKKIYLEKFTSEDFDQYYQLVSNEQVMAKITERSIPLDEAKEKFKLLLLNNALHPLFGHLKITEMDTNEFIGLAKLKVKEMGSIEAELGYMLLPEYWGKGICTQVASMLVEKAKSIKQLDKLVAIIDPANIPSRKILIKNGFKSDKLCEIDGLPGEILSMKV
ncbi:GNAT family N-acetyltransferase [Vallitalea pronyensis]|uniref:GNAT family N-acetyltransferase n=1 Tax=Vallitalea pronyensis TaxID=1348613 RepID=A0A8J8MLG7_9FIRM|nr:GNAT family N-acetyltransferase [Vallitalea pronyensis]